MTGLDVMAFPLFVVSFPTIKGIFLFYDEEQLYIHIKSILKKSFNSIPYV